MCCIDNSTWRGLAALLILVRGQCEGLRSGMGEKLETPMPFLFPLILLICELLNSGVRNAMCMVTLIFTI